MFAQNDPTGPSRVGRKERILGRAGSTYHAILPPFQSIMVKLQHKENFYSEENCIACHSLRLFLKINEAENIKQLDFELKISDIND